MGIFRNKEIKQQLLMDAGVTVVCSLLLFFLCYTLTGRMKLSAEVRINAGYAAAAGSLFTGILFCLGRFWMNQKRYREVAILTQEMDKILHGNELVNLSRMQEGDMEILRDEIQKMIIRLREQNEYIGKEKKSLADSLTDISHQIRTPLTSLNLMLEKIRSSGIEEQEKRKCCYEMERMLERIEWLITSLLKIAKLEAGSVRMEKEHVSAEEILKEAFRPFEIAMELKGQQIIMDGNAKEVYLECDRQWTVEAVANVIKNSMEHTPDGGFVKAECRQNPLFDEIAITDSGEGISEKDMPHLFERFYRGTQTNTLNFGIGLSFARLILANQNAVIFAENVTGGGARFVIRFYKGTV